MVHLSMEVSDMKKFLLNIAIFFAIVAAVDFSLGKVFHYLQARAGGRTGAEYYVCEKATEDVIIMGSSRASHHYVPEIISEKLGMSCFNAGQDGNGIILHYGRWIMLKEHHIPKLIIYDITTEFDIASTDNMIYVDRLKPFCNNGSVMGYVTELFPIERIKLQSKMYRYNYKWIEMISDCILKSDYMTPKGYIPMNGHIRKEVINSEKRIITKDINIDSTKLNYLERLIKEAQAVGVKIIFVVSPIWKGGSYNKGIYLNVKSLASKYDCLYYEYSSSEICDNPDYFEDSSHLNDKGAKTFTEVLTNLLLTYEFK